MPRRWWNDQAEDGKPSPGKLAELLDRELTNRQYWVSAIDGSDAPYRSTAEPAPDLLESPLGEVGMSDAVQSTFLESLTRAQQRELGPSGAPTVASSKCGWTIGATGDWTSSPGGSG